MSVINISFDEKFARYHTHDIEYLHWIMNIGHNFSLSCLIVVSRGPIPHILQGYFSGTTESYHHKTRHHKPLAKSMVWIVYFYFYYGI